MAEIVRLPCITRLDTEPALVLDGVPRDLKEVLVIGTDAQGALYFSGSMASGPDALWLLEVARRTLMDMAGA